MERRVLLAFLLSFFVFLLFVRFFGPESAPPAPPADETPVAASPASPPAPDVPVPAGEVAVPETPTETREAEREQTVAVETSRYVAEFSNRGGRLLRLRLLEHTDSLGAPLEALPQGDDLVNSVRPLDVVLPGDPAPARLTTALHEVAVDGRIRTGPVRLELRDGEAREIEFRWASADGLEVSKTVRVQGGDYRMGVSVSAIRGGAEQLKEVLFGPGIENESSVGRYQGAEQGVIESGGESRLFSFAE
ncbi:MAG: membrane protein insertase YidC, partial [Acidobacteriota bacterium]|nr:membrane protein insertase YidC [Acidobacteriota bacterium]